MLTGVARSWRASRGPALRVHPPLHPWL